MRAIIQRVTRAAVTVDGAVVSEIGKGLCVLVGISRDDTAEDVEYISRKIISLKVFENDGGSMWKKNVKDLGLEVLCVSQFTLYARCNKNKPDFHMAMGSDGSKDFYGTFLDEMKKSYDETKIKDGEFGAHMNVDIQNDGPVTIVLDSNQRLPLGKPKKEEEEGAVEESK
eukprot:m.49974 g.49974  ORF g.49974 m.49974 type:complete len:170 (-) comp7481_c2_seq1:144-653(-)